MCFVSDVVVVATKATPETNQLGYTVQAGDVGRAVRVVRVVVDYTDDQGTAETYASEPTDPVQEATPDPGT